MSDGTRSDSGPRSSGAAYTTTSATELASLLEVNPVTVYRWASAGRIPSIRKPGKPLTFDVDAVKAALEAEQMNDAQRERARKIRERDMARAEETLCFEVPGHPGSVVIVAHPGRKLDPPRDDPEFDKKLMQGFGIRPDQIIRLSESSAAPRHLDLDDEIAKAEDELEALRAQRAVREQADARMVGAAESKVAALQKEKTSAKAGT